MRFSLVMPDDWPSKRGSMEEVFNGMIVFTAARDINVGRFLDVSQKKPEKVIKKRYYLINMQQKMVTFPVGSNSL